MYIIISSLYGKIRKINKQIVHRLYFLSRFLFRRQIGLNCFFSSLVLAEFFVNVFNKNETLENQKDHKNAFY